MEKFAKIAKQLTQKSKFNELRTLLSPHTSRAYLVGGCVRDALLGRECYDYDVEIYDIDPIKFDTLMQNAGANCVGKSYFIYKFKNYDLGLPRTESKTGERHRDFDVSYANDERIASMRRDFTINAMMINLFSGELLDCWGGARDLKAGVLRHIDEEKFCEDALRVLRGVQFAARLNFSISPQTLNLMRSLNLDFLSRDRVASELVKFFRAPHLDVGARYLGEIGLLRRFFGVDISGSELENFCLFLKNARKFVANERLFLYILGQNFSVDIQKIVLNLGLPKSFLSVQKEPVFVGEPSDFDLLKTALKMPLKSWLGCYDKVRTQRAKQLKIYEAKIIPDIDTNEILAQGYVGASVGEEIKRRQICAIKERLKSATKA